MTTTNRKNILIVDDDKGVTTSLSLLLKQNGYFPFTASSPGSALQLLEQENIDLVFQDMNFSRKTTGEEGLQLLEDIKNRYSRLPVILMTAWGSVPLAVKGIKLGAADFVTKPWSHEQIIQSIQTALILSDVNSKRPEKGSLSRTNLDEKFDFTEIIGEDQDLLYILDLVGKIADTSAPVLITGESGTGKELIAEAIWKNSSRFKSSFVKVNLGGIPNTLFESEMFGHVKGAYTDAKSDRVGRFETADKGTLFLDEIGEIIESSQVKLLRVLQDRNFERLGSSKSTSVDVRIISATNQNLVQLIDEGKFREDLFHRLNLIMLNLPSLRDRKSDIKLLATHFLKELSERYDRENLTIAEEAIAWLTKQTWPGNIRQLRKVIERTVLLTSGSTLSTSDIKLAFEMEPVKRKVESFPSPGAMTLDAMERKMILSTLEYYDGHITKTSDALGISRSALYRRLEKHGIEI
jgi:DNA-binding NtrC family response regulator